ncbi:hypothetical protein KIL84_007024 [Mauremys mutica]|uniref:Uncharacterized protein n=1 Tax=Mauremys mutica TaxID=74926 RepID=A0A9D4AWL5_9SAUR|nr:hypothetical protein KIL84_007024 [Mauremys mutica]
MNVSESRCQRPTGFRCLPCQPPHKLQCKRRPGRRRRTLSSVFVRPLFNLHDRHLNQDFPTNPALDRLFPPAPTHPFDLDRVQLFLCSSGSGWFLPVAAARGGSGSLTLSRFLFSISVGLIYFCSCCFSLPPTPLPPVTSVMKLVLTGCSPVTDSPLAAPVRLNVASVGSTMLTKKHNWLGGFPSPFPTL